MASLTLTEVWLHQASDPSTVITLEDATGIEIIQLVSGDVQNFAIGRRWITTNVEYEDIKITALYVDRDDVDTLRDWVGDLLVLRDPTGRQIWGVYSSLSAKEKADTDLADVNNISFVFMEVIGDEEV